MRFHLFRDGGFAFGFVRVLPGAYLAREVNGQNPGHEYIRAAMVAPKEEMRQGLIRLRDCIYK